VIAVCFFFFAATGFAQDIAEPFKVGTFEIGGTPTVGLVLRDSLIIELNAANAALERSAMYPAVPMPANMIELIERYDYGLKRRLYEIVNNNVDMLGNDRPGYVHNVADLRTLPPIMYPGKILNAAVNFYSHVDESGTEEERDEAARLRREERGVPYLFMKPSRGAVVGNGAPIVIPYGRNRTDWEVELGAVIGRTAKYVSAKDAEAHIFGYMVTMDISDRGGRPPGGAPFRSDWFVGKGHDTFAPQGPWIVPKEFYGNPMEILRQSLSVGDEQMQEATAGDMIHSLWELVEYGSSIITLYPGDVINRWIPTAIRCNQTRGQSPALTPEIHLKKTPGET
jgi:2-keto-4-pentenoate hydratase/2-oxohepta-3-ene-1,7-dioic acid hydratase in catechol pathway